MIIASRGRLLVLAAPSGAGKTSLVHALLERIPILRFSISCTTRPRRSSEIDGVDYFFVSDEEFQRMARQGEFLEYAQVFDHWYGTGRRHVEQLLDNGHSVVLELDWQGARKLRESAPEALNVFILPPSLEELARRLRGRGTDSKATIERRLEDALSDMHHWSEFDYALINDDLAQASDDLAAIAAGQGDFHLTSAAPLRARIEAILGNRS